MISRPVFQYHLHVEVSPREPVVYLFSERRVFALQGRTFVLLAPLLDGTRTRQQILQRLAFEASREELETALAILEERGHVCEADDSLPPSVSAFWNSLGLSSRDARRAIQEGAVCVQAVAGVSSIEVEEALEAAGITVASDGRLEIVLVRDYLEPELEAINRRVLAAERTWLLAKNVGRECWLGPLFRARETGCWECLAQRIRGNRQVETAIQGAMPGHPPIFTARGSLPSTQRAAAGLIATEAAKWLARGISALEGSIMTLDWDTLTCEMHRVVKRPQCSACGRGIWPPPGEPHPLQLRVRKKLFTDDGGHRVCSPEATLAKYEYHVSRITGIIHEMPHFFETAHGLITLYRSPHILYHGNSDLASIRERLGEHTSGKGKGDSQARASALCEALERYCWQYTGEEPRRRGSLRMLGEAAVHPHEVLNFSETQYREREARTRDNPEDPVPEPFDSNWILDWAPLWSLTQRRFRYLPMAYCYAAYRPVPSPRFCWADSNGNAAGNVLEEAILQGFFELVERDSVALWWYSQATCPEVDLDSFGDRYIHALQRYYGAIGREFWVLDITTDLGIPAFTAINRRLDGMNEDVIMGFGAHLDSRIALLRALTEMNQLSYNSQVVPSHCSKSIRYQNVLNWFATGRVERLPYLAPNSAPAHRFQDFPQLSSDDLREDIETCIRIAQRANLELLVLNQTRPDVGLSVVKVVVPGLRYWSARFGPGRLYAVPPRLGWVASPLREDQLNQVPFPH
jgi:oxazoline/thiazoline synthase